MTTDQLMRTQSLSYRLTISEAALELLHQDAHQAVRRRRHVARRASALAAQLSGALELGRVSSRMAARSM
jgi:hypothetical protein